MDQRLLPPMTVLPVSPAMISKSDPQTPRKRKQVKNACSMLFSNLEILMIIVNCQKACKKCDDARPCGRCVKYGLQNSCVDSVRKERKKGMSAF
jgi:hypothetical protein